MTMQIQRVCSVVLVDAVVCVFINLIPAQNQLQYKQHQWFLQWGDWAHRNVTFQLGKVSY